MKSMMYPLILGTFLLAGLLSYFFWPVSSYSEAATIGKGAKDFQDLSGRFEDLAKNKGGVYAYEVLKRAELPPNTDLHLLGHAVGNILYTEEGVDGVALCTQDFRNACSHSIVIGALNEFGEPALPMIREACKKAPGGSGAYTMCFHGLGHGVFAYYGYELPQTVAFCKQTGTEAYRNREYVECIGGTIMELVGGGGHDRNLWLEAQEKYLDTGRPLAPCTDALVPTIAKEICLTYLTPHMWESVGMDLGNPDPEKLPAAFKLCDTLSDQNLRDACFGGFGKEFTVLAAARDVRDLANMTDEQLSRVISWCEKALVEDGTLSCVRSALNSLFWGGENDPELSFRYCERMNGKTTLSQECYKGLASNIAQYIPSPRKEALCQRLPTQFSKECAKQKS